jgi:hypothetical protein
MGKVANFNIPMIIFGFKTGFVAFAVIPGLHFTLVSPVTIGQCEPVGSLPPVLKRVRYPFKNKKDAGHFIAGACEQPSV